jgi:hypothetical protein
VSIDGTIISSIIDASDSARSMKVRLLGLGRTVETTKSLDPRKPREIVDRSLEPLLQFQQVVELKLNDVTCKLKFAGRSVA